LFEGLWALNGDTRIVVEVVGGAQLIDGSEVPFIEDLLIETTGERLVVFG